MPERDGKDQEEVPKASGLVLVRLPLLTSHNKWRELVSSGRLVCRCHGVFSLVFYVCFLICFASFFVSMLSLKPRPFVQSSFDMRSDRHTCFFLFFPFLFIWRCRFLRVFFCTISAFSLYGEYVVRFFLPDGVFFLPCDHGLDL